MYSCAVFEQPDMSLAAASTAKLERICRKLNLRAGIMSWRSAPAGAASRCTRRAASAAASPPRPFRNSNTIWPAPASPPPDWKIGSRCCSAITAT
jgi:hypothetical protein